MSGGGRGFSLGGRSQSDESCSTLVVTTILLSPYPLVIAKLRKGETLNIVYTPPKGPLLALDKSGNIAGTILTKENSKIVSCINDGFTYVGTVKEISGGNCTIIIKCK